MFEQAAFGASDTALKVFQGSYCGMIKANHATVEKKHGQIKDA